MQHFWLCKGLTVLVLLAGPAYAGLGLMKNMVSETPQPGAFPLVTSGQEASLCYDTNDYKGVIRAVGDLQADIERVTCKKPRLSAERPVSGCPVIVGTLGKSETIDRLVASGKLNVTDLKGKWESFVIATIDDPAPGVEQALVIAGSDKRGTIYGIYELSEQLGVSPWYWWADVPVKKRAQA